ncbi:MAG TPA: hypothetical protein VHA12_02915 [Candidatus Nanoarchaeia archaeon]|nr:hypothetical protein [Candidatus Nanoarchaeia archaeon]
MSKKIRVNITVDKANLEKAKTKLHLFGGKLSTLFNAYLEDFVSSMDKDYAATQKSQMQKIEQLEKRLEKLEKRS